MTTPPTPTVTEPAATPDLRPETTGHSEVAPAESAAAAPGAAPSAPPPQSRKVRIQLLGHPAIFDRDDRPVTGLRLHARQLLVYLAVHRAGADLPEIMEALWPYATLRRAGERLSTEVANLRSRIRQAAADDAIQPVINTGGRYVLDTDLLDIDLWHLTDALRRAGAAATTPDQIGALRDAVDAHTGTLAEGHDYEWIEPHREQVRRHGIHARLQLADLLTEDYPRQAATLAQHAADLDKYNEDTARHAMRALALLGDTAGIQARLRHLRQALDDIDEEPSEETLSLAAELQQQTPPAPGHQPTTPDTPPQ